MIQGQLRGVECNVIRMGNQGDPYCVTHMCYKLDCLQCGTLFHTERPHTKYCKNACRQKAYRDRMNKQLMGVS